MINEQENKTSLNKMSDLEYTKNDTEMMRYRVNGLSYKLGLVAMITSLFAAFICLNSVEPRDYQTIIVILINVVILLGGFLSAEMVKNYNKKGAIAQMVFGAVCIGRIFWLPLNLIINYNTYVNLKGLKKLTESQKASYDNAKAQLAKTILSKHEGTKYATAFLPADGNFRGIVAIVLLVLAAVAFIAAGIIGYKRAQKLSTYLESLKDNK